MFTDTSTITNLMSEIKGMREIRESYTFVKEFMQRQLYIDFFLNVDLKIRANKIYSPVAIHMCFYNTAIHSTGLAIVKVADLLCVPWVKDHRSVCKYPFQVSLNSYKNTHKGIRTLRRVIFITFLSQSPNENKINILLLGELGAFKLLRQEAHIDTSAVPKDWYA